MSFERLRPKLPNQLNPVSVARHDGTFQDMLRRYRKEVRLALAQGEKGVSKVVPYLATWLSDERILRCAWEYLAVHGGKAPGPDGKRYEKMGYKKVWKLLHKTKHALRKGTYKPGPERIIKIPKTSGRGTRELALQNIGDRAVQRAVVEILQPLLDSGFDDRSFGYRPQRNTTQALAEARVMFRTEGRHTWLAVDVRDAFRRVPIPRLLQIVHKYLPSDSLIALLEMVLANSRTPGLRQGGSASPILLNIYLNHHLDQPWRRDHPTVPLIRYADDILVLCKHEADARKAYRKLKNMLLPAGLTLRETEDEAVRTLTDETPADWVGYRITRENDSLRVAVAARAWDRLAEDMELHDTYEDRMASIKGWISQLRPCYRHANHDRFWRMWARSKAAEVMGEDELFVRWQRAYARWRKALKARYAMHGIGLLDRKGQSRKP